MIAPSWVQNPVAVKELRSRMRGGRAYWGMTAYALALSAVAGFWLMTTWTTVGTVSPDRMAQMGREGFIILSVFQLYLASFVAPTLTAGAITGERERLTLDLLRITRLSSREIVLGKMASSLSYLMFLIASSVPVCALIFWLGGVSPLQMVAAYAVIASTAVLFGAVGLSLSAVCRRTATAVFVACVVPLFLMVIGPPSFAAMVSIGGYSGVPSYGVAVDLVVTLLSGVVPIALAVTVVLPRALGWSGPMGRGLSSWLAFSAVCAALMVPAAALLTAQPSWSTVGQPTALCFCPTTAIVSIVLGANAHPLLRLFPNIAIYWFGLAAFYLLAAADLIALAALGLDRIRAKG